MCHNVERKTQSDSIYKSVISEIANSKQKIQTHANQEGDVFIELKRQSNQQPLNNYKLVATKEYIKLVYFETLLNRRLKIERLAMPKRAIYYVHSFVAAIVAEMNSISFSYLAIHFLFSLILFYAFNDALLERISKLEKKKKSTTKKIRHYKRYLNRKTTFYLNGQKENYALLKILPFFGVFDEHF